MGVPLAVSPTVRTPGLALAVNLLASPSSPGTSPKRAVIIAAKSSTGTGTADTTVYKSVGPDDVKGYCGPGSPGHLAASALFQEYGLALVDLVIPAAAAGSTAAQTVVFDDTTPVTVAQVLDVIIAGRTVEFVWQPGRTKIQAATDFTALVNALGLTLPVTAANGGGASATSTLTFKVAGTIGNDCLLYLAFGGGTGGAVTLGGAALAGGTTEPSLTAVLALISNTRYDYYLPCVSNTDAGLASNGSNVGVCKAQISTMANAGLQAKLQQMVVGLTGALSNAKTGAAQHDFGPLEYVFCNAGQALGCEWGGAELGARLRETSKQPTFNRIGQLYRALLYGARDLVTGTLTGLQEEDALQSGVAPVMYDTSGNPLISRPITTYFKDTGGNLDSRILDVTRVDGIYTVALDIQVALPQEFPNRSLSADLPPGQDELPDGVTEVRDVKAFVVARLRFWQKRGVVRRDKLDEAIANGSLIVQVDPVDASQCDIVLPLAIVPPLAKFSVVVQQVA